MKCAIIFLSLVALGYAVPLTFGKSSESKKLIKVHGVDTISIYGSPGKKVIITRIQGFPGQRNVEIFMEDKSGPTKKIWFNNQGDTDLNDFESQIEQTEADILVTIFRNHQGTIDHDTFVHILTKIRHFVQTGHIDETVLYILKTFDSDEDQDSDDTGIIDTSLGDRLQLKLQKLLRLLGLSHKTTDLEKLVREDPVFINKLVRQSLSDIDQDDLIYLKVLLQKQQALNERRPVTWLHKHIPISLNRLPVGSDSLVKQQPQLLQIDQGILNFGDRHRQGHGSWEDLFDSKIDQLERKQELFRKLNLNKFNYGEDLENNQGVIGGKQLVGKGIAPELFEDEQDVEKWSNLQDQTDEDKDLVRTIPNQLQQGNIWQQRYSKYFTNPRDRTLNYQHRDIFADPIRY